MELPVIGEQHFGLSITSDREAQLTLQGAIDLDEPIYYNVGSNGKLEFTLSETTNRILGRLGTTLLHELNGLLNSNTLIFRQRSNFCIHIS